MSDPDADAPPIDPWLLEKLVCPVTRTPLRWDAARQALLSDAAGQLLARFAARFVTECARRSEAVRAHR